MSEMPWLGVWMFATPVFGRCWGIADVSILRSWYWADAFGPGFVFYVIVGLFLFLFFYSRFSKVGDETPKGARNKAIIVAMGILAIIFLAFFFLRPIFEVLVNQETYHDHSSIKQALEKVIENEQKAREAVSLEGRVG